MRLQQGFAMDEMGFRVNIHKNIAGLSHSRA